MGFHFTMQKVVNTKILKNNTFHQFRHSTTFGVAFHHPSGLTECINFETQCWRKWSSTVDDQPKVPPWQRQVWDTWRIDGGIVTISIFVSTSIPFPLYFAIHLSILFKSSFTISITKLFYFQPYYYSAFYYSAFYYSAFYYSAFYYSAFLLLSLSIIQPSIIQLFYYSALLLSDNSTSINTLDFHL